MHKFLIIIIFLTKSLLVFSQVEMNRKINFTETSDTLITIKNIGIPTDSSDGVSIYSIREKNILFGSVNGINLITLNLAPPIARYEPGLFISFKASAQNTGNVQISIDGLPPVNIKKFTNQNLDSFDLTPGKVINIVYDGYNFQAIQLGDKECPGGFLSVNENLCIEENSKSYQVNFFNAAKICMENKARLCSWSEWVSACERLNTPDNNFTSHWEWVNTSSDHGNGAKIVGNNICGNNQYLNAELNIARFRCCYTK
jgi:hypothetical protein